MVMREEQVLFLMSGEQVPVEAGVTGVPKYLLLGISKKAWEYMRKGKNHNFDLRRLGLPMQLILFGGATHDHLMDSISLFTGPVPKVADMHTDNKVKEDERVIPMMRAAARKWEKDLNHLGTPIKPLEHCTDAELDNLFDTLLKAPGEK